MSNGLAPRRLATCRRPRPGPYPQAARADHRTVPPLRTDLVSYTTPGQVKLTNFSCKSTARVPLCRHGSRCPGEAGIKTRDLLTFSSFRLQNILPFFSSITLLSTPLWLACSPCLKGRNLGQLQLRPNLDNLPSPPFSPFKPHRRVPRNPSFQSSSLLFAYYCMYYWEARADC